MIDKHEMAKLGLAFAVGTSLSAGYVVLGNQLRTPDVVVVQELCPEPDQHPKEELRPLPEGLVLAPMRGEHPVPEGVSLWVGLDGLWLNPDQESPLLQLENGQLAAKDVDRHRIRGLELVRHRAKTSGTAVLWIDHRVPGATLIDLFYTLERAGFHEFALVVRGLGAPEAFRFESKVYASFVDTEDPWTAALSLRLESTGVSAWLAPRQEGRPTLGAPEPLPLTVDEVGECMIGTPLPERDRVARIERELCELQGVPLAIEYAPAADRSVGDLLALRAMDARSDACRGPSNIVAPEPPAGCEGAMTAADALARFAEAAVPGSAEALKATVVGALEKDQVRRVVAAHIDEVRVCYNEGLKNDPELAGTVAVEFVIDERGEVVESGLGERTDLADRKAARCIANAISHWKFPAPEQGEVVVGYPFMLSPG